MLWLACLCVIVGALAQGNQGGERVLPPIVLPESPPPGVFERCDVAELCLPYSKRIQYSYDFLCCEDGNGWVAAHILNPLAAYMFFGDYVTAWFIAFVFEAFEVQVLLSFGGFVVFETNDLELESWAGSVIGDAFIQGGLGVFLAYLLVRVTNFQPMFSNWSRMPGWLRLKYFIMWAAYACSFITLRSFGPTFNWGLAIALALQSAMLLFIFPNITASKADLRYVWFKDQSLSARNRTFIIWWLIDLFIGFQSIGFQYLPNDWFQTWLASVVVGLCLLMLAKRWPKRQ